MTMGKLTRNFTLVALVFSLVWALAGCSKTGSSGKDPNVDYFTCTMHPSVKSQDAKAKCPICSMDLVPVMKKGASAEGHDHQRGAMAMPMGDGMTAAGPMFSEFSVPVERQQQIGVTYAAAEKKPLHHAIRSVGMVVPDKTRHWEFVARVEGYVQKLYVTSPGEPIEEGQPLLTIYSPELSTAEREMVNLLDARDRATTAEGKASTERSIGAARRRLEQWNITATQIAELEKTRKPSEFLTLNSPFKGVVEDVPVDQGRKVMIGDHLVDVADLSLVWVWAEFYEDELSMLAKGQKVRITAKAYPGQTFEGELSLINPFLMEMKRTAKVRVDIPNADFKLRPGMYVNLELAMDMGEGLTIPVSAVMPTGSRTLVFVDKSEGKLEPRAVQLGRKYGDIYEVLDGLKEGERVVASANFLIDAESKVQGAVKSFEEPPRGKMEMKAVALPAEARQPYELLFAIYLAIQKGLTADDFNVIAKHATPLREQIDAIVAANIAPSEMADAYRQKLEALKAAAGGRAPANLEEARIFFGQVSAPLVALTTQFSPPLARPLTVAHCPMWEKSPADWIQAGDKIENPFMGSKMPGCGAVVTMLGAAK
jgi:RND family efflux transporter MFP subunit